MRKRLQDARRAAGMTQQEAADRLNIIKYVYKTQNKSERAADDTERKTDKAPSLYGVHGAANSDGNKYKSDNGHARYRFRNIKTGQGGT